MGFLSYSKWSCLGMGPLSVACEPPECACQEDITIESLTGREVEFEIDAADVGSCPFSELSGTYIGEFSGDPHAGINFGTPCNSVNSVSATFLDGYNGLDVRLTLDAACECLGVEVQLGEDASDTWTLNWYWTEDDNAAVIAFLNGQQVVRPIVFDCFGGTPYTGSLGVKLLPSP